MKLGQITYFMIIYNKNWNMTQIFQILPDSPNYSDFQNFPDIKPDILYTCQLF